MFFSFALCCLNIDYMGVRVLFSRGCCFLEIFSCNLRYFGKFRTVSSGEECFAGEHLRHDTTNGPHVD